MATGEGKKKRKKKKQKSQTHRALGRGATIGMRARGDASHGPAHVSGVGRVFNGEQLVAVDPFAVVPLLCRDRREQHEQAQNLLYN